MPIRHGETLRAYHRQWMAKRRAAFFAGKRCVRCGSCERLELHHRDQATKKTHNVWSWRQDRRDEETAKCEVLCHDCHQVETVRQKCRPLRHGTTRGYRRGCRCDQCRAAVREANRKRQWALRDSNAGHLPCDDSALPLS